MYWYISFLRPAPVSTTLQTGSIIITPQVSNDLRTELRDEPTDIGYTWQRVGSAHQGPSPLGFLTTFKRYENAYKSITVPLPNDARHGESWRLGLFPFPSVGSSRAEITSLSTLSGPDPAVQDVWSEPIRVLDAGRVIERTRNGSQWKAKYDDTAPKQTRITREWGLEDEVVLRIIEQTSFDLDKKVWDSGLGLSSWLFSNLKKPPDAPGPTPLETQKDTQKTDVLAMLLRTADHGDGLKVLELGGGTGLVSVAFALTLKATSTKVKADIITTDLPSALPLMEENLTLNGLKTDHPRAGGDTVESIKVIPKVLDWDQPLPEWLSRGKDGWWPDIVIAADVTYNTASFPALVQTLSGLLNPDKLRIPKLLLAYKQRDPAERGLWKMLEGQRIKLMLVDTVPGSEDYDPVEIWMTSLH